MAKRASSRRGRPKKRATKRASSGPVSIRLGNRKLKRKLPVKDKSKNIDREIYDFEKSHKDSGASPAKVRKRDEHIAFRNMRKEIERNMGDEYLREKIPAKPLDESVPVNVEAEMGAGKKAPKTAAVERAAGKAATEKLPAKGKPSTKPYRTAFDTKGKMPDKIKTGIRGLDDILGGGLPKDSIVLLSGTCGTGKSIFGMNFLIEGAMKNEPGIYISLEESPESNIHQMKLFGWPVDDLIKNKKLMILQPELYNFDALLTTIEDSIDRIKAKRLVIDAISIIGMYFEDPYKVRKSILQLGSLLKKMRCTTIAIDEVREGQSSLSAYGVEEFVVDGVIVLYLIKRSNIYLRAAVIRKMRGVNHSTKIHPMEIKSPGGIIIYPSQELFEEVS